MMASEHAPGRILVVSLDNLGDLVFASALTPPLHAAFPGATIDVWCRGYTAGIATLIPHIDTVIAAEPFWTPQPDGRRPSMLAFLRSLRAVRQGNYDAAVLSEAPWRAAAAVAVTGIPVRIGAARHHNTRFLTHIIAPQDQHKPVLHEQARLLTTLDVHSDNPRYRLDPTRLGPSQDVVASQLPERFAAFHPFAAQRVRCVPVQEWISLAFAMLSCGLPVLWVGTPAELDELRHSHTHPRGFFTDQLGDGSLAATAAALSRATIFVGHDSGPMHIAGAFGVPVVGVFAPGQPDRTFPQGVGPARIICRPTPAGITRSTVMREIDELGLFSTT